MTGPQHAAEGKAFDCYADFYKQSAYAKFDQEHRAGGSFGVRMFHAVQDPIDLVDSAVPDLILGRVHNECTNVTLDVGDGPRQFRRVREDAFTIVPANTEERFYNPVRHEVSFLAIDAAQLADLLEQNGASLGSLNRGVGTHFWNSSILAAFRKLWATIGRERDANPLIADGLALQIFGELTSAPSLQPLGEANADTRIVRVVDYIEAHLPEPLSVTELAAIATMSAGHFSRCFKATVGEPVWAYVQRRRCERAKDLLLHSREPLAEIAYRTGFANQAHMTTSLKERFGATPGAIRKEAY